MPTQITQIEKLKKAVEVLTSNHVASVEVGFECEMDDIRFYTAVTYKNGEAHRYQVRVQDLFENGERQTWAKCNCHAGANNMVCRHVLKVAEVDADRCNRDLHLDTFVNYKAYKGYHCKNAGQATPTVTTKNGLVKEACSYVFDWNSKFYASSCEKHDTEARNSEWAMEADYFASIGEAA
jgi:hypothetical protein